MVDPELSLEDMNEVIEGVMPWMGHHMHRFYNKNISVTVPFDDPFEEFTDDYEDYEDMTIGDFLKVVGDKCKYEYDFGDSCIFGGCTCGGIVKQLHRSRGSVFG